MASRCQGLFVILFFFVFKAILNVLETLNSKKSTYEPIVSDVSNNKLEHTVDPL